VGSGQDYKAPDYWVHEIQLVIKIYEEHSQVHDARLRDPERGAAALRRPRPPTTVRAPARVRATSVTTLVNGVGARFCRPSM